MDIVCYLPRFWDIYSHRPHLEGMSKFSKVICFQPPITFFSIILHPKRMLSLFRNRIISLNANLYLYQLISFVPYTLGFKCTLLRKLNYMIFKSQSKKVLKMLNFNNYCVYIFRPEQEFILDIFPNVIKCYEVHDEYSEHPGISENKMKRLEKWEKHLLKRVNIVFAFSENIYDKKKRINSNTHFIRNAIMFEDFSKVLKENIDIPNDLKRINPPIIGFAGRINELMDVELMNYLIDTYPEWSFVMLGEINAGKKFKRSIEFASLMNKQNLFFLGWKDYSVLPIYYKCFDVCIMPYLVNEYGNAINPQKTYQYSAVGKPVVSTNIRDVRPIGDIINIAKNKEEFGSLVENCLNDNDIIKVNESIQFAKENSVIVRAKEKLEIVEKYKYKIYDENFPLI